MSPFIFYIICTRIFLDVRGAASSVIWSRVLLLTALIPLALLQNNFNTSYFPATNCPGIVLFWLHLIEDTSCLQWSLDVCCGRSLTVFLFLWFLFHPCASPLFRLKKIFTWYGLPVDRCRRGFSDVPFVSFSGNRPLFSSLLVIFFFLSGLSC